MKLKAIASFSHPESDSFGRIQKVVPGDVIEVTDEQGAALVNAGHVTADLDWKEADPPRTAGNPEERRESVEAPAEPEAKADEPPKKKK